MNDSISILHVDDDPSITDLTATFLERENDRFTVDTAASADEGFDTISDRPPDCIISDYNMPGMDGIEFLQAVREKYPDLPFILFTGKGSEAVASEAIAADVTDYLQKGAGSEQYELLANRIGNAVQGRRESERADRQEKLMRLTEFAGDTGGFELDTESGEMLLTNGVRDLVNRSVQADFSLDEAIGLYHPEDQEDIQRTIDRTRQTGEQTQGTWRLQAQNSPDERLVEVTFTPATTDGDNEILRGSIHDITDQHERQQELKTERRFIEQSLDVLDDLFYVIDTDGTLRRWNAKAPEVTGYSESELDGMPAIELVPEDDRETATESIETALSDGADMIETDLLTADGHRIPYEFTGARLADEDGNTAGLVGIGRDVTGGRERTYRELAEEYEALLETSGDAIFMLDVDTAGEDPAFEFTRLSPGYETQTGISTEEVRGKTPQAVFGEERGAELEANYTRCLEQRGPVSYREELEVADDARFWETSLAPVIIDTEVIRIVGIARNVTAQVERERELQRQNERLDEFASIVSHDLRSPLTVAAGTLELARKTCESTHLVKTREAIARSQALIDDLLRLAREGHEVAEVEPVALGAVAENSWQTAETKRATLETDVSQIIHADESRLQQLFENLYRNAIDHGRDDVTVWVDAMDDGFSVADTGPGIPESDREEIFEAGYSTSGEGTGFGLRIVQQIADAHGWDITVTDSEQGGARFDITGVEFVDSV